MAANQTSAEIILAIKHAGMGSSRAKVNSIPWSMMVESASVSSKNGQTRTNSSREAGAALDLERSDTRR